MLLKKFLENFHECDFQRLSFGNSSKTAKEHCDSQLNQLTRILRSGGFSLLKSSSPAHRRRHPHKDNIRTRSRIKRCPESPRGRPAILPLTL